MILAVPPKKRPRFSHVEDAGNCDTGTLHPARGLLRREFACFVGMRDRYPNPESPHHLNPREQIPQSPSPTHLPSPVPPHLSTTPPIPERGRGVISVTSPQSKQKNMRRIPNPHPHPPSQKQKKKARAVKHNNGGRGQQKGAHPRP